MSHREVSCRLSFSRRLLVLLLLALLAGCTTAPPSNINDACVIFAEKDGWFRNWYKATDKAQKKYGVSKAIILATLRQESAFRAKARPPRKKLLGFIPWRRPSNAYGYPQALDSTWDSYRDSSGNTGASRKNFADAADFVGWYYAESRRRNGIALTDAYRLYITYYLGHGAYARGQGVQRADVQRAARSVVDHARRYTNQMRSCGYAP